jgi:RNA polymerase sigma factor (sigma-70 family)
LWLGRGGEVITQTSHLSVNINLEQASDEPLILACLQGDGNAWDVLVKRYQRLIYTIPRRAGLDEDQAAEVFQRTFVKLLENLPRVRRPASIHAWLVTTARRETLHLLRLQHMEQFVSQVATVEDDLILIETIPDDQPLPNEQLESLEEQHVIREAIAAMDERSRKLLTLLYYHPSPLSYAEIAEALDIPEGSVGPTRARCLLKLRRMLEQAGY